MPDPRDPGRIVHRVRRDFEAERSSLKDRPGFLLQPWEERHPEQRDLDNRIYSVVAEIVTAKVRGQFGHALREHYLAGVTSDRARHECNPVCACSDVFLGWHLTTGGAVEAWIGHVMQVAGGEDQERSDEKEAGHGEH
jgi:hypothetical protein